jgi:hypothetical protein
MKLITILTSFAGLALAAFTLGLIFDRLEFPLFDIAIAAWFVLLTVHAYVPARRRWQPRPAGVLAASRRTAALPLAV